MSGTNSSTRGFRRFTRHWPRWDLRLLIFAVVVTAALFLIVRVQRNVGLRMADLDEEFGAIKAESFYVGVQVRTKLRRLNELLLRSHLTHDQDDVQRFLSDADQLKQFLKLNEAALRTAHERVHFDQIKKAYDQYLTDTRALLPASSTFADPAAFTSTYQNLEEKTRPLLDLIEEFVVAQQGSFNQFLGTSQNTLESLQRLLTLSLLLLLASTLALVVLVYRGMIAPLRRVLSQTQAVMLQQEKLASLGTLAAGVAHEIRNPLTAIKFRLFSLKTSLPALADHEDAIVISTEINRLERIVKDFLQFARPADPEVVRLPAQRLLQEVVDLLGPQIQKAAITLRFEPGDPVWLNADPQQLKQVIINLVQNAAESIGSNGVISLRILARTERLDGASRPAAVLSVADTGRGIPPDIEKRLFDPFFTTKENGTGLGLAIAARVVAKHGGLLRYHTRLHLGTTFEIVLPAIDDHAPTTPPH
jgi:signal transduction histidine kinase